MNSSMYYQALASLIKESVTYNYPRAIKEVLRKGELTNVVEFQDQLLDEVINCPISDEGLAEYFWFITSTAASFALYRSDFEQYHKIKEAVDKRISSHSDPRLLDDASWKGFMAFLHTAGNRLARHITIEQFEAAIDDLDWSGFETEFIPRYSGTLGLVYMQEADAARFNKARFWLQKASSEASLEEGLIYHLSHGHFLFSDRKADTPQRVSDFISRLDHAGNTNMDPGMSRVFKTAASEMQFLALLGRLDLSLNLEEKLEETLSAIREIERSADLELKTAPATMRASLKLEFARAYLKLATGNVRKSEVEDLCTIALDSIDDSWQSAIQSNDPALVAHNRLLWMQAISSRETKASDKELKDLAANFKKAGNNGAYVKGLRALTRFYLNQNSTHRGYEVLIEAMKSGIKNPEEGGFYLALKAFELINDLLLAETTKPAVSWMVKELDPFFAKLAELVDLAETRREDCGLELFNLLRKEYSRLEPASHFNAKVWLKYQYYSVKLLRVGALYLEDDLSLRIADTLIMRLDDQNNPLSFIRADWPDFKDVPNSVRNKMLNKCISISKGDLPMAADHLDFSYRNLRSYITFNEVNRLGFFLEEKQTSQKQLEMGIRLMFHDLYKSGTIFEVVFDMPKFLVQHAAQGFSSLELEEALDIKGTTAKKYIKIMIDIGLIKHEKSLGRKHFYVLRRTNIMNRFGTELGNEQKIAVG